MLIVLPTLNIYRLLPSTALINASFVIIDSHFAFKKYKKKQKNPDNYKTTQYLYIKKIFFKVLISILIMHKIITCRG